MDYLEIMDFCGFDLERADAMARSLYDIEKNMEGIKCGVGILESESHGAVCRRLRDPRRFSRTRR